MKSSDVKFRELEQKMKEYEELLLTADGFNCNHDKSASSSDKADSSQEADKLSTIAETASLEGQVADLEEEIEDLKAQLASTREQKYALEREWEERMKLTENGFSQEKANLEESVGEAERRLQESTKLLNEGKLFSLFGISMHWMDL